MYPKILDLGPITIHTYGLLLAAAFICGIWISSRIAAKNGVEPDSVWNMGLIIIFSALVGAKIILFFSDIRYYSDNPREIFSLSTLRASEVYYGGLFLALLSAVWFLRKKKLPFWTMADIAVPGIALGQIIARLGCLSAGCCYGKPTHLPWGVTFTSQYAYENVGVPLGISLHPTQVYEAIGTFLLFLFLLWSHSQKPPKGQIFLQYIIGFAFIRFLVEFFRGDERAYVLYGFLSTSQLIAIFAILGSVAAYFLLARRPAAVLQN
jgi:phosphatidylglycerol---prolipoprotein diacylglyceryl transferase